MWKASLAKDPILLTTEMSLQPISNVVAIINEEKGHACYEALCDVFGIEDFGDLADLDEKRRASQAKQQEEEEKLRLASNSRAGSIKAPSLFKILKCVLLSPYLIRTDMTQFFLLAIDVYLRCRLDDK